MAKSTPDHSKVLMWNIYAKRILISRSTITKNDILEYNKTGNRKKIILDFMSNSFNEAIEIELTLHILS